MKTEKKYRITDPDAEKTEILTNEELISLASTIAYYDIADDEEKIQVDDVKSAIKVLRFYGFSVIEIKEDGGYLGEVLPFPTKTPEKCGCKHRKNIALKH